jgi:hypothetical protein
MKFIYSLKTTVLLLLFVTGSFSLTKAQTPTIVTDGVCAGVVANFNTNDNGFNSPSIYGSIFDSSFYYNASRGYWTDYLAGFREVAPGFPRVLDIISPPYLNPNPIGSFNVGFYYIINNPVLDRFQVRIISVTSTPMGTISNVEATSGVQTFAAWSHGTMSAYGPEPVAPGNTPFMLGTQGFVCIRLIDPDITNGPNTTYRVEVAYLVNDAFFAVFDNLSIGPALSPLPVDFIGLVANRDMVNDNVDLKWDVSSEVNVKEYQVERSQNGSSFSNVGTINAKGKSIYTFTNFNVSKGTVFYRIRSVDIDGRAKYSGVIKLSGDAANSYNDRLGIYPVPANDEVMIEHKKLDRDAKMIISTVDGKVLRIIVPATGSSHTPVRIADFSPGIYILRLEDGMGGVQTGKLIKN